MIYITSTPIASYQTHQPWPHRWHLWTRQFCIPSAINGQTNLGTKGKLPGIRTASSELLADFLPSSFQVLVSVDYHGLPKLRLGFFKFAESKPHPFAQKGWFMDDLWMIFGWFLDDFWMIYGWFLDDFWMIYGWFLDDLWVHPLKWCASHRIPCQARSAWLQLPIQDISGVGLNGLSGQPAHGDTLTIAIFIRKKYGKIWENYD